MTVLWGSSKWSQKQPTSNWKYQKDNAPIHTSHLTTAWFTQNQLTVKDWPAISPDLIQLKIYGEYLHERLFPQSSVFDYSEIKVISRAEFSLHPHIFQTQAQSMPEMIFKIIKEWIQNLNSNTKYLKHFLKQFKKNSKTYIVFICCKYYVFHDYSFIF